MIGLDEWLSKSHKVVPHALGRPHPLCDPLFDYHHR